MRCLFPSSIPPGCLYGFPEYIRIRAPHPVPNLLMGRHLIAIPTHPPALSPPLLPQALSDPNRLGRGPRTRLLAQGHRHPLMFFQPRGLPPRPRATAPVGLRGCPHILSRDMGLCCTPPHVTSCSTGSAPGAVQGLLSLSTYFL